MKPTFDSSQAVGAICLACDFVVVEALKTFTKFIKIELVCCSIDVDVPVPSF